MAALAPAVGAQLAGNAMSVAADNAGAEPAAKRLCLATQEAQPVAVGAEVPGKTDLTDEERAWQDQWAEVFARMQEGGLEARAGEYAEAVVALRKNAEGLRRQRSTVRAACEQLLHTAYREALQAHLRALRDAAAASAGPEIAEAARRTVDAMVAAPAGEQPGTQPAQQPGAVTLGIGLPQPGVVISGHVAATTSAKTDN
mmetsp:Transcript_79563/g.177953  ORF Transcript_79563/g.177953 Transcript_79563/m.177953 type:complete len:200 (-) Transcript_79563:77-676(-)